MSEVGKILRPIPENGEVILDIGTGNSSFRTLHSPLNTSHDLRPLGKDDIYVGLEYGERGRANYTWPYTAEDARGDNQLIAAWARRVEEYKRRRENGEEIGKVLFVQADGGRIPFQDSKFDLLLG